MNESEGVSVASINLFDLFRKRNFLYNRILEIEDAEGIAIEDGVGVRVAAFRDGGRARVQVVEAQAVFCLQFFGAEEVGMSVKEDIAVRDGWQGVFIIMVAVGREDRVAIQHQDCVVGKAWEIEHHLIDFGLAVAANRPDFVLQGVQHGDDFLRGIVLRKIVSGAMVQDVAEEDDALCTALLELLQGLPAPVGTAVDVACYKIFAHWLCFPFFNSDAADGLQGQVSWPGSRLQDALTSGR